MSLLPNRLIFAIGVICILVALFEQTITLTSGHYAPTLVIALAFTVAADVCFATVIWKGNWVWRTFAAIMLLPTLYVIADFLRRAPGAF